MAEQLQVVEQLSQFAVGLLNIAKIAQVETMRSQTFSLRVGELEFKVRRLKKALAISKSHRAELHGKGGGN